MGVDAGGHLDADVSKQLLGGAQIHSGVVQAGGIAVPLRYNYDKPEKPRMSRVQITRELTDLRSKGILSATRGRLTVTGLPALASLCTEETMWFFLSPRFYCTQ